MDIIMKVKSRLECKINVTLLALLPNKIVRDSRGPVTSSDRTGQEKQHSRNKRAIPLLAIAQGTAAIGGMLLKGINALVDAKRVNSFNNAIKMLSNCDKSGLSLNTLFALSNYSCFVFIILKHVAFILVVGPKCITHAMLTCMYHNMQINLLSDTKHTKSHSMHVPPVGGTM